MILWEGTILRDRYRVIRSLGEGGFGTAYLVQDLQMSRQCVVKTPRHYSAVHLDQFEREAKILAELNHPNLPEVYGYFVQGDQAYLVMEYIKGTDLEKLAKDRSRPFGVGQVVRWANDLLNALVYLHGQNPPIIHRDIKPSNVCITPERKAVLLDFGIARLLEETHTQGGAQAFTPRYAPIEQHSVEVAESYETLQEYLQELKAANIHTGPYSDVYSLGVTLYFGLTLEFPPNACWRVIDDVPISIRKYNPGVPDFVIRALDQATMVDPRDRCQTAAKFKQLLQAPNTGPSRPPHNKRPRRRYVLGALAFLAVTISLFLFGAKYVPSLIPLTPSSISSTPLPSFTPKPSLTPSVTPTAIPSPTLSPTPTPYVTVSDDQLNVYAGPGEVYDVLGHAQRGSRLPILGCSKDGTWWHVEYLNWHGWVATKSVVADVSPSAVSTVEAPPTPINPSPVVKEIDVPSTTIEACDVMSVTCKTLDQHDGELTYTWEASDGFITGEGDSVTYNAPKIVGSQIITVTVQGRTEREVTDSIQVQIVSASPPPGTSEPAGIFGQIWQECEVRRKLGWATGEDTATSGAQQYFDQGIMFWREDIDQIYVLMLDGTWQVYQDTWEEGMDAYSCASGSVPRDTPPTPVRGFGKVWCDQLDGPNAAIGWALDHEQSYQAHWQSFENGLLGEGYDRYIYVLYDDHSWQSYPSFASRSSQSNSDATLQRIRIGDRVWVCTAYDSLAVRAGPGRDSSEVARLEPGAYVRVVDGPAYADGRPWWQVQVDSGAVGWVAEGGDEVDPYYICPEG